MTIASDRPAAIDLQTQTLDLYLRRSRSKPSAEADPPAGMALTFRPEFQSTGALAA